MEWTYPKLDFEQRREADEVELRVMDEPWNAAAQIIADRAEIARLTAERDEAKAVAVWAARNAATAGPVYVATPLLINNRREVCVRHDGTDASLYRALVAAMKGGRDRED